MLKRWKLRVLTVGWFTVLLTMGLMVAALFPAQAEDYIYAEVYTYDPGDCAPTSRDYVYGLGPKEPLVPTPWEVTFEPDDDFCDPGLMLIGGAGYKLWLTAP